MRSSASHIGRLYPQECFWYSFSLGAMVRSDGMSLKNPVTPPGIDPGTVRLVAQCLNHYATPGPIYIYICVRVKSYHTHTHISTDVEMHFCFRGAVVLNSFMWLFDRFCHQCEVKLVTGKHYGFRQGCTKPGRLNCVPWRLSFMLPQCGAGFISATGT